MNVIDIDINEQIIVYVVSNTKREWYIADKELWFLDYKKRTEAFKKVGYIIKEEYIDERRRDLLILDSDNVEKFLNSIDYLRVSTSELKEALTRYRKQEKEMWAYKYSPSLYIDFDKKELYSIYSENESYEDYVPSGWKSGYEDFFEKIPSENRYWESENSDNLLKRGDTSE